MTKTKIKILIVEDDQTLRDMYSAKFVSEDFEVIQAENGVDGLAMAKSKKPAAILLDVMMPKLDGFATLKELKADKSLKKIPVVMLTNLGQEEDIKKGKELGAADYFVKANQTPAEIVAKVKVLIK